MIGSLPEPAADPRWPVLDAGLRALQLACTEPQAAQLLGYLDLLAKWNRAYNLTAVRDAGSMVVQHLLDCAAALPSLAAHSLARPGLRVLDVGSGGGLPGVVWAILQPDWQLWAVDTVAKKVGFLRQVAAELGLRHLRAEHMRVEELRGPGFDVVVCRAFASLPDFVQWTRHLVAPGRCWLAMKGQVPEDEIAALPRDVEVFHVEPLQVPGLDARRCLVWMRPR